MIFGVSSATGPLIGGAFTEKVTWRWCFYMNLPIGVAAFACLFFFMKPPKTPKQPATLKKHIMRLDPLGTLFFIPSMVCLVLALQWGGSTYEWRNWRLIVLWVCFGLTALAFATVQVMMPESASLPVKVITQRTVLAGTWYMLFLSGAMFLAVYYIPLWCKFFRFIPSHVPSLIISFKFKPHMVSSPLTRESTRYHWSSACLSQPSSPVHSLRKSAITCHRCSSVHALWPSEKVL